jgi:hypothetical protein
MGGVALQQVFIFVFCYFAFELWHALYKQKKSGITASTASPNLSIQSGLTLLYALVMVLVLITVCNTLFLVIINKSFFGCWSSLTSPSLM